MYIDIMYRPGYEDLELSKYEMYRELAEDKDYEEYKRETRDQACL